MTSAVRLGPRAETHMCAHQDHAADRMHSCHLHRDRSLAARRQLELKKAMAMRVRELGTTATSFIRRVIGSWRASSARHLVMGEGGAAGGLEMAVLPTYQGPGPGCTRTRSRRRRRLACARPRRDGEALWCADPRRPEQGGRRRLRGSRGDRTPRGGGRCRLQWCYC